MLNMKKVAIISICVFALLMGGAHAQEDAVGSVEIGYEYLSVIPVVSYGELRITVSGGGVYVEERFSPGEITDLYFGRLRDGRYTYEIIASPDVDQTGIEDDNGDQLITPDMEEEEKEQTYVQSGSFEVVDGEIKPKDNQTLKPTD
jgi:hypothetical protein